MQSGFIVLGIMGRPMAKNLLKAGHPSRQGDVIRSRRYEAKARASEYREHNLALRAAARPVKPFVGFGLRVKHGFLQKETLEPYVDR